jgi:hypothetical protein
LARSEITSQEIGWLAGWLEGEGTFYFTKSKSSPTAIVQVFSVDRDIIEKAARLTKGKIYWIKPRNNSQGGYRLHLESDLAIDIMEMVLPLMGERRTVQIKQALEGWRTRPNKPIEKLCACGCGRIVFGGPRVIYAISPGICSTRAWRAKQKSKVAA